MITQIKVEDLLKILHEVKTKFVDIECIEEENKIKIFSHVPKEEDMDITKTEIAW